MNKFSKLWYRINVKRRLCKDFTASYYKNLISEWKERYGFISFMDDYSKPGILLRHDIDRDLNKAVHMAEIEADINNHDSIMFNHGLTPIVHSTYFILNTADYWENKGMIDALKYIQSLGHEIGWHNNVIAEWIRNGKEPYILPFITDPINHLRDNGITIRGTSAHGDRLCFEYGFMNYNVFGFKSSGYDWFDGPTFPLNEFGLKYEAYHIPFDDYIVDSYTGWARSPNGVIKTDKRIQILIHPHCWRI